MNVDNTLLVFDLKNVSINICLYFI